MRALALSLFSLTLLPWNATAQSFLASPATAINHVLPKWMIFGGDYRIRPEGSAGGNFRPGSTDVYAESRIRLDLTIRPVWWLTAFAEGYDARVFAKDPVGPPYENTWDLRHAYLELGSTELRTKETRGFGLRAGRQDLTFGDQRLIGNSPWTNAQRSFDAIRATFHYDGLRVDAFSASVVNVVDGAPDHHQQGNNLHGLYVTHDEVIPRAKLEAYILWRTQPRVKDEEGVIANLDEKVIGTRVSGTLPASFDYAAEMVREYGSLAADNIHAWASHVVAGHTWKSLPATPRLYAEYNFATGDKNAKDGTRGTFDQLYPTSHDKYGLSDQVGWRNIRDLRGGIEFKPHKAMTAVVQMNDWYLDSIKDSLYNSSGTALFRSATGAGSTHVGEELEFITAWTITGPLTAGAGIGHIFPGQFLRDVTPGKGYTYPYAMFTYKF